jgi:hypothetical protein
VQQFTNAGGRGGRRRYGASVFSRPDDLDDTDIVAAVAAGWGVTVDDVEYAAVGFGSHHWRATTPTGRWFVTVDDLDARRRTSTDTRVDVTDRLTCALTVARSLSDAGLDFVVAPVRTTAGSIVHPIGDRYVAALYPHVDGETHEWGRYPTNADCRAVLDRLIALHQVDPSIAAVALVDDFAIPARDRLVVALADPDASWGPGPFAESAHAMVRAHADRSARALGAYDQLVARVVHRRDRMVLTHGEPHRGNTIDTPDGVVLIDWDTALLAPPERDLWMLVDDDPRITDEYRRRTGVDVDDDALQLYRMWWDLCEVSLYVDEFRRPHAETADTRHAFEQLTRCLQLTRWVTDGRDGAAARGIPAHSYRDR